MSYTQKIKVSIVANGNKARGLGTISLTDFVPYPKNPVIASVFKEIGWAEELGSGVRNIVKYSKVYSGTTPEFVDGNVFKTKISLNGTNRNDVGVNVGVKLSETERKVLECIKRNGEFSAEQIAEKIKRDKRTVERAFKSLKEQGIIERNGSDKAGSWKVIE